MKKIISFLITIIIMITISSCNSQSNTNVIVASTYPAYDLTKRIVGDKYEVVQFVPMGQEPHDYEPTANKISSLYDAKLYIEIGFNFEEYTKSLPENIKKNALVLSDVIEPLYSHHGHDHEEDESEDPSKLVVNPHIWLSIKNAIKMLESIYNKMVEIDSENKTYYENNYLSNKEKFEKLDQKYETTLSNKVSKYIATTHEAFGYLCRDYGLEELSIMGISNAETPTAAEITQITSNLKEKNVKVIFGEESGASNFSDTIANMLNIKKSTLNTIEALNDSNKDEDYLSLMEINLQRIKEAICNE